MNVNSHTRILVAGIGNIFLGDDGFGSVVARRLQQRKWPDGVRIADFGIRGIDLVYALMDRRDLTILIDAAPQGEAPGTLFMIEPDLHELRQTQSEAPMLDGHTMDPVKVLRTVFAMGGACGRVVLIGCEPAELGGDEGRMGLSAPVEAAIDEACMMVESLIEAEVRVEFAESDTSNPLHV